MGPVEWIQGIVRIGIHPTDMSLTRREDRDQIRENRLERVNSDQVKNGWKNNSTRKDHQHQTCG